MKRRKLRFYSGMLVGLNLSQSVYGNELIVETFENLDFGFNSHSIHQLIAASIVILVISALMVISIALFRCYMLYCRNIRNTRHIQIPLPPEHEQLAAKKSLIATTSYGATAIENDFLDTNQLSIVNQTNTRKNTFRSIFDDSRQNDSLLDV